MNIDYDEYLKEFEGGDYQELCEYVHTAVDRNESIESLQAIYDSATDEEKEDVSGIDEELKNYHVAVSKVVDYMSIKLGIEN